MKEINPDPLGTVDYRRPKTGHAKNDLTASLGRTDMQELMPGVAVTQIRYQDFIIDAVDLDFGAGAIKPEVGDEIERKNGQIFRVISLGDDVPPFDYVTATAKRMRIHTELYRQVEPVS